MKIFFFLTGLLLTISAHAASTQVDADKVFDGNALNCSKPEDLKNKGFLIREVQVTTLKNGLLRLSFDRPFVICTSQGWAPATHDEYFKFSATDSQKNTYQFEYIKPELVFLNDTSKAYQLVSLQNPRGINVAIDVRAVDLLDGAQRDELNVRGKINLKLDVFLRMQLTATSPQGLTENWGYRSTGTFRMAVPVEK